MSLSTSVVILKQLRINCNSAVRLLVLVCTFGTVQWENEAAFQKPALVLVSGVTQLSPSHLCCLYEETLQAAGRAALDG